MRKVITVDGPSGVGKGTLCQALARDLGWAYLDSGALYRLLALAVLREDLRDGDTQAQTDLLARLSIDFATTDTGVAVLLNGEDVTSALRNEDCAAMASELAAKPEIRAALLDKQRDFAADEPLVADGRDMGTVVFPQAPLKIYLTASAEVRAQRRYKQLKEKGDCVNLSRLTAEIAARDARDSNRAVAPLKPASDAVVIDTGALSIESVLSKVKSLVSEFIR
ncbi:(d)CMP kinase [Suttonella sp. R2A3]|uniref:(d)CMP kinase n=1 Tax=Suttonella sp. R2A3 TaxID=2908648 RepID=UPI0028806AA2|nr:(d)CMP kinase [Suttonella sp. R2A3]